MPQEENVETIPLLRGPFLNPYYIPNNNRRSFSFSLLGYGFIVAMTLLISINLIFYYIESNEATLPKGNSRIPYQYYLGLKSENWPEFDRFEYVIEPSPPSDPTFSNLFEEDDLNSTLTEDSSIFAEIVSRNYKAWAPAYYEVRENVYKPNKNFTVLTTQSHMSGLWFIIWPPKVSISFVASGDDEDENNDNEELLKCNYEISWAYKYFGEIHRKCSNEGWIKVAYVKGTSEWGMQWLDPERIETYGIVTKPAYGKNRQMRNVVIRPDSPFPPIIPALYVAYYDRIIGKDSEGYLEG